MTSESQIITYDKLDIRRVLRRYMDLGKLLDLLYTRELYFRRADGFSDRLEGALFPLLRKGLDSDRNENDSEDGADYFYKRARLGNYVSCWNMSAKDSMALWQLYGGDKNSIAVTTTIEKLMKTAWCWRREAHFAKVQYLNHRKVGDFVITHYKDVLQYKHTAYAYEKEVRIVLPQQDTWQSNPMGIRLPIEDINDLIRSVVVSPEASAEFYDAIRDLCKKYGVQSPVRRSEISFVPT